MGAEMDASMSCRTYLAVILPASVAAAGCARLVPTKAMRAAAGMPASVGRLPPACHRQCSKDGGPASGGKKVSPRAAVTGSAGGVTGGGGIDGLACPLDVSPRLVISVKVCSALHDAGVNSQHGSTL